MQLVVRYVRRAVRLEGGKQGTDDPSKQQGRIHLDIQSTCSASGNLISALELLANLQEKDRFFYVVHDGLKEGSRRTMVAALRW